MLLHFTKMHGLGNDFMVVDLVTQRARLRDEQIRQLADRRFGIGFDQLLIVEPPRDPDMDFRYRIYNADGSEVENCGNGARCFARFVRDQRLTHKHEIHVETAGGPLVPRDHLAHGRVWYPGGPNSLSLQAYRRGMRCMCRVGPAAVRTIRQSQCQV